MISPSPTSAVIPATPVDVARSTLSMEGDYWTVTFQGNHCRVRDCDGLWYLAALVSAPRQRLSVLALVAHKATRVRRQVSANPRTAEGERARVCVSRALHALIERLRRYHPGLGEHLAATLRTGMECIYDPDPRLHDGWDVRGVEL